MGRNITIRCLRPLINYFLMAKDNIMNIESEGSAAESARVAEMRKTAHICGATAPAGDKKRLMLCGVEFVYLYYLAIPATFIGWLVETIAKIYQTGVAYTHLIPFIAIYGLCVFGFHLLLGDPDDVAFFGRPLFKTKSRKSKVLSNIISLAAITAASFFGELIAGNGVEILFGVKLWDYSFQKYCFTQYVSLISTVGFGFGGYLAFRFLYMPALAYVRKNVKFRTAKIWNFTLGLLILADGLVFILQIIILRQAPNYMIIKFR